jgi:hypothetical protein
MINSGTAKRLRVVTVIRLYYILVYTTVLATVCKGQKTTLSAGNTTESAVFVEQSLNLTKL